MAKEMMKTFFSDGEGRGHLGECEKPQATGDTVVVRVSYCGICGTDQDLFSGDCSFTRNGEVTYPLRPGHEWSGVVEEVGELVRTVKPGDRVVGDNAITCGVCESCRRGNYAACRHTYNVGTIDPVYDGAFAEYFALPERHVCPIPENLTLREAALAEPISVAYGATRKMDITSESTVVVIGTGCIGLSAVILARCAGAKQVLLVGRNPAKLRAAEELGAIAVNLKECDPCEKVLALTGGAGSDFVIECSGAPGTFVQAVDLAARKGKIALIGFYENKEEVEIDKIVSKELSLVGIMGEYGNMKAVLKLLAEHRPRLEPMITDELALDDCAAGFLRKNYPNAVKIMVKIGG